MRIEMEKFRPVYDRAREWLLGLSPREHLMIASAGLLLLIFLGYKIIVPISNAFSSQRIKISEVEQRSETLVYVLDRHLNLLGRKEEIESAYREVEMREGVLSYLENLIKEKAGVESGYTLRENQSREFAGQYEQTPHTIRFTTTKYPELIDFLNEIVHGPRPLILTRLDMRKGRAGSPNQALTVELDVSTLRRTGS